MLQNLVWRLPSFKKKEQLPFAAAQLCMQPQFAFEALAALDHAIETAQVNQQHAQNNYDVSYIQKTYLLQISVRINELENKNVAAKNQTRDMSGQLHTQHK